MREEGVRFLVLSSLQSALLLPVKETQKTEAREEGGGRRAGGGGGGRRREGPGGGGKRGN